MVCDYIVTLISKSVFITLTDGDGGAPLFFHDGFSNKQIKAF